uniref:SAC domain-containing protein n=1 Tax=Wuchereria bancrofti TaxID=6293 RepID=A0AAF5Q0J4_WUCBA
MKLSACSVEESVDAIELGEFVAFIGKILVENECYLLVVVECTPVATYPCTNDTISHIDRVIAIPVEKDGLPCKPVISPSKLEKIKISRKKVMHFITGKGNSIRLIDEILQLFNGGDFYICFKRDITLNTQSNFSTRHTNKWFFWNYALLSDLFNDEGFPHPGTEEWIIPVCQGFVAEREVSVGAETKLVITLISRRSINCAGVRYLKRGVDGDGDVANFVETEVVLTIFGHCLSYVQIRGSVPVFWTQQGYRYRPPLVISKTFADSYPAFNKHVTKMIETYGAPLTIVNLVEQRGREMQLSVSFLQHILHMNSPNVAYFTYDFHFRCRGLRFHKVADLISALTEQISTIGFCWIDKCGEIVRQQQGVIRTNCVDCLDRTNVVQCAISQALCLVQAQKLGIVGPQTDAPLELIQALQTMWADNGDAISRQYAGTDALKGDITRSGQRNLVGMVKDGYNSASRYYLSHMRDAQRQLAVDTLLGMSLDAGERQGEQFEGEDEEVESIGRLVREAILFILPEKEILVGGWALVEGSNSTDQIDSVLVLTKTAVIVASYDDDTKLSDVKHINFDEISGLEYGRLGKSSRTHLRLCSKSGELFNWRAARTRLFNNVAIQLRAEDEADEYIQAIGEQIKVTMSLAGYIISFSYAPVLSKPERTDRNKRRMMNMVASVFRSRSDCSMRSQFEHTTFSRLDDLTDDAITSCVEKGVCAVDDMISIMKHTSPHESTTVSVESGNSKSNGKREDRSQQKQSNNKNLLEVSHICSSKSDDHLTGRTDDFISLLQKFKLATSRSSYAVTANVFNFQTDFSNNVFSKYRQQILDSKSRIILL